MTDAAAPRTSARVRRSPVLPARPRRLAAVAALSATAAVLLSACGNSVPGTAAVVGDQRITDSTIQDLVDQSLGSPGVRAALPTSDYKGDLGAYRRSVLNVQVERILAEAGAQRLGLGIDESKVEQRYRFFEQQLGGSSSFASELASRLAVSPALYRQLVRTEVIESEIGYEQGGVKRPTEAQIQALYQQYLPTAISATLSLVQVPDQATATREAAAITAAPDTFAAVAKKYAAAGGQVAAEPQKYPLGRLPQDLAAKLQQTPKNTTFGYKLASNGQTAFFVIRFAGIDRPTLESVRPQLEAQTLQQAAAAGQKYLSQVASDMGVTVNPRYGTWKQDDLSITDFVNPVIKPTPSPANPSGGTLPGGEGSTGGTGTDGGSGGTGTDGGSGGTGTDGGSGGTGTDGGTGTGGTGGTGTDGGTGGTDGGTGTQPSPSPGG